MIETVADLGARSVVSAVSNVKVHVVIHDNDGGWSGKPVIGLDLDVPPFFGYVLGNLDFRATGKTEQEVLERIKGMLVLKMDEEHNVTRKIVELDIGDHILVHDVMDG